MIEVKGPPVDLNYQDEKLSKNSALHMACANGHAEIIKLLLKQSSIKSDLQNDSGNTPLHYAAFNGKKDIVEMLINHKANANLKNLSEKLPIEDALQNGHVDIAEMLASVSKLEDDKIYSQHDPKSYDKEEENLFEETQ